MLRRNPMIACPTCGAEVARRAHRCPSCGERIQPWGCGIYAALYLGLFSVLALMLMQCSAQQP